MGAVVLALKGGFVAIHARERVALIAEATEGESGGDGRGVTSGCDGLLMGDFEIDLVLLDAEDAEQAPAGGGHGFDEFAFGGGGGAVFGHVFVDEGFEPCAGFGGEDDGLGEHAVAEVAGGGGADGLAFGCGCAGGFRSVGAG